MSVGHRRFTAVGLLTLALAQARMGLGDPPTAIAQETTAVKVTAERTLRLPETPYHYANPKLPAHFRTAAALRLDNTPNSNGLSDEGAALGRVLFYDTKLSGNNTVACASCHFQKNAFASPDRFSKGWEGKLVDRHAMGLGDVRYYGRGRFFWDERAPSLEAQVLMPIQSKIEMGQELPKLLEILKQDPNYPELFRQAFGTSEINKERMAKALAQFVRSMVSFRSKFDVGMSVADSINENFVNFTNQENQGKTLFLNRCANCHMAQGQSAHFFMNRPFNNGLDSNIKSTDGGFGDISLRPAEVGLFKSPSLRNVEFTAHYMHDGRFSTLAQVIEHYSTGVKQHPNLDFRVRRFNFSGPQKASLVAFLKTLSDHEFITDPKFSDPFQQ